jgi:tetratricopeptide (TPR) repeat protein
VAYGKYGDFTRSIEDFNTYMEKNPDNASAYSNRGLAYNGLKQYDLALKDFARSIELDTANEGAHFNRAITYRAIGDIEPKKRKEYLLLAREDISRCIELNPKNGYYHYLRGIYSANIDQKEEACEDFHLAVQKNYPSAQKLIDQFCNQ